MNHIQSFVVAVALLAISSVASAVPTEVDVTVPAGASETQIASFQTPAGAVTSEVFVGRFLIDYPAPPWTCTGDNVTACNVDADCTPTPGGSCTSDEVIVQVQTHDLTQARFKWAAVTLNDPLSLGSLEDLDKSPAAPDRVIADLFVNEVPATEIATATTHRLIEVRVIFSSAYTFDAGPHTWNIRVFGVAGSAVRYIGLTEEGTDLAAARIAVTRPKIVFDPAGLDFEDTQVRLPTEQTPILEFKWLNLGTDEFESTGSLQLSGNPFSFFSIPAHGDLKPGEESATGKIQFRPTTPGSGSANEEIFTITGEAASSGAAVSASATLTGNGVELNSILLLDVSGSMSGTKIAQAKDAGLQLYNAFRSLTGGQGRFGLFNFPDTTRSDIWHEPSATDTVPLGLAEDVFVDVTDALREPPTGLKADGETPMYKGLDLAIQALPDGTTSDDRPSVLLLSDGYPDWTDPLDAVDDYTAKAARIFPVGFGNPAAGSVPYTLLSKLATDTSGMLLTADPTDAEALKKAFRGALREWLGMRDDADPEGTVTASQSKSHDVCLDDKAYQAVFVVDWYDQREDAISFTLETPLGATLTPSSPDLAFSKNKSYAMYVVYGQHIRGGKGAGLWKLNLMGSSSLPGTLGYQYSAMTQAVNPPKPSWTLMPSYVFEGIRAVQFYAGEPWILEFPIDPTLKARIDASEEGLRARLDAPTQSLGTFLAKEKVKPEWVFPIQSDLVTKKSPAATENIEQRPAVEPLPIAARKAQALAKFADQRFEDKRSLSEVRLRDDGQEGDRVANDNLYTAVLPSSQVDGLYDVNILLELAPTHRGCTNIDTHLAAYVPPNMIAAAVAENVQWNAVTQELFFDPSVYRHLELGSAPKRGYIRQAAIFTAKDDLGNYLGPGQAAQISFEAENARLVGPVVDNWDGSYIQVVEYEEGTDPALTVSAGGFRSEPVAPTPQPEPFPPQWFWWLVAALILLLLVIFLVKKRSGSNP